MKSYQKKYIDEITNVLIKCGVPRRFWWARFENFNDFGKSYVNYLKKYSKVTPLNDLLLYGNVGSGKTHLAVSLIAQFIEDGRITPKNECRFLPASEYLFEIKSTYNSESVQTEDNVLDKYSNVDLLILDDLGAESVSEWAVDRIRLLVDRRYRNLKPIIVTSNLTPEMIESKIDPRVSSRFAEGNIMLIDLPDFRRKR